MMRKLRKLADLIGQTVEHHIHEAITEFVTKRETEGRIKRKIIRFPER